MSASRASSRLTIRTTASSSLTTARRATKRRRCEREFGDSSHLIESQPTSGFAGGANLGHPLRRWTAAPTTSCLLNNDTMVDAAFLSALVGGGAGPERHRSGLPEVVLLRRTRGHLFNRRKRQPLDGVREADRARAADAGQFERIAKRDYADGVCMLIPRRALETVGLLDEEYFAYWEETDWCIRAREKGLRCYYVPNAKIWHKAARVQSPTNRFQFLFRRNALMFVRKRGTRLQVLTALLAHRLFLRAALLSDAPDENRPRAG